MKSQLVKTLSNRPLGTINITTRHECYIWDTYGNINVEVAPDKTKSVSISLTDEMEKTHDLLYVSSLETGITEVFDISSILINHLRVYFDDPNL